MFIGVCNLEVALYYQWSPPFETNTLTLISEWYYCSLILKFSEGVEMLRANGVDMGDEDDLR